MADDLVCASVVAKVRKDGNAACISLKPAHLAPQLCVNTVLPLAPLALGRGVLLLAGLPARHDLYAGILGIYVLWAGGLLLRQVYRLSQVTHRPGSAAFHVPVSRSLSHERPADLSAGTGAQTGLQDAAHHSKAAALR